MVACYVNQKYNFFIVSLLGVQDLDETFMFDNNFEIWPKLNVQTRAVCEECEYTKNPCRMVCRGW